MVAKPSNQEIVRIIDAIKSIDLSSADVDQIKTILQPLFVGYTLKTPCFDPGLTLFRGSVFKEKPKLASFCSYPPLELARANRANRASIQCFYGSTSRATIFYETKPRPGDMLLIGEWISFDKLTLNNVGYTESNFKRLNSNRNSPSWGETADDLNSQKFDDCNTTIAEFLSNTFSQDVPIDNKDIYKLTAAIAEKHFSLFNAGSEFIQFDGLLYPTVQMYANAENIALTKNATDEKIYLSEVEWVRVNDFSDGKYDIDVIDWADSISEKGEIEWKGRLWKYNVDVIEKDTVYFDTINGKEVLRDRYGNVFPRF